MWEFSVQMDVAKTAMAKYIYNSIKPKILEIKGVITTFEQGGVISIVMACSELEKARITFPLAEILTQAICTYFKEDYLERNLKCPPKSELEIHTFKKALVSFDAETDRFLVNKQMKLEKNLVMESFFYFKLPALREKWQELVKIANDNSTYFLSDESFVELLRFLVDNIEYNFDEVNVFQKNEEYFVFAKDFSNLQQFENPTCSETELVDRLFLLSPRKINWYGKENNVFLNKIFAKRLKLVQDDEKFKIVLDNCMKLM